MPRFLVAIFLTILFGGISLLGCTDPSARKAHYLEEGKKYLETKEYQRARVSFQNLLKIDPKDHEGRYWLAKTFLQLNDVRKAVGHLRAALEEAPDYNDAKVLLAQIYFGAKMPQEASKLIGEVLESEPKRLDALVLKAAILATGQKFEEARKITNQILELDPGYSEAIRLKAALDWKNGDKKNAIEILKNGLKLHPRDSGLKTMLAQFLTESGDTQAAEKLYLDIAKQEPGVNTRMLLARFYITTKQPDQAVKTLRQSILDFPDNPEVVDAFIRYLSQIKGGSGVVSELQSLLKEQPTNIFLRFKLAGLYLKQKNINKSQELLNQIIELSESDKDRLKAKNLLAEIALMTGDKPNAEKIIREILAESPQDPSALLSRARIAMINGDSDSAISDLRAALVSNPKDVRLLKWLAEAHLRKGEFDLARDTLEKATKLAPTDAKLHIRLSEVMRRQKMQDAADKVLAGFLKRRFDREVALRLFQAQMQQGNLSKAEALAGEFAKHFPEEGSADYLRGLVAQAKKEWQKAINSYEKALEKQPKALEPLQAEINTFLAMKAPEKALLKLQNVIQKQPGHYPAQYLLGQLYWQQGNREKAISAWKKTIALKQDWPLPYQALANAYVQMGQPEQAVQLYQQALSKDPENQTRYLDLALLLQRLGKIDEAIGLYDEAIQKFPDTLILKNNLASLLLDYRKDKESLKKAERLAESLEKSRNPAFIDTLGWLNYKKGNYQKARELIEKAIENSPRQPVLQFHMAEVYRELGEKQLACQHVNQAIQLDKRYNKIPDVETILDQCNHKVSSN